MTILISTIPSETHKKVRQALISQYPRIIKDKGADLNNDGKIKGNEILTDVNKNGKVGDTADFYGYLCRNAAYVKTAVIEKSILKMIADKELDHLNHVHAFETFKDLELKNGPARTKIVEKMFSTGSQWVRGEIMRHICFDSISINSSGNGLIKSDAKKAAFIEAGLADDHLAVSAVKNIRGIKDPAAKIRLLTKSFTHNNPKVRSQAVWGLNHPTFFKQIQGEPEMIAFIKEALSRKADDSGIKFVQIKAIEQIKTLKNTAVKTGFIETILSDQGFYAASDEINTAISTIEDSPTRNKLIEKWEYLKGYGKKAESRHDIYNDILN